MSMQVRMTIQCDGCREHYDAAEIYAAPHESKAAELRREAMDAGWKRKIATADGLVRDFCPRCLAGMAKAKDVAEYAGGPARRRGAAGVESVVVLAAAALAGFWWLPGAVLVVLVVAALLGAPDHVPWRRGVEPTPGPDRFVIDDGSPSPWSARPNVLVEALGRGARRLQLDRVGRVEVLLSLACLSCAAGIVLWLYREGWIARWMGY